MKRLLWPTVWLLVVAAIGAAISMFSDLKFVWALLIVAAAILINALVATLEDDLPDGFNNSDGTQTPRYAVIAGWVIRGLGVTLGLLLAVVLAIVLFGGK